MGNLFEMPMNLQLFAGEGGAAGGDGAAPDAGAATGVNQQADAAPARGRARRANPFAGVRFGIEPPQSAQQAAQNVDAHTDAASQDAADGQQQKQQRPSFKDLIKGEYKDEYKAHMDRAMQGRFRDARVTEERMGKATPILQTLAARYGIAGDPETMDLDALSRAVEQDQRMYEDAAMREGVPVEVYMQQTRLQRQQQALDAQRQQFAAENAARQEMGELMQQAQALQAIAPEFDLEAEMEDPRFARMVLKPPRGSGVPLEAAYYAMHHAEIEAARRQQQIQVTQHAVQQTAQRVANAVASGSRRPTENGVSSVAAAATRSDSRTWSKEERAEVRRRVRNGEKIYL